MKKNYNFNGQQVPGEDVEFETEKESWSSYILHDGTRLRLKSVVASIVRLDGVYSPTGDPVYLVNAQPVMAVDAPDTLKKK